MIKIALFALIQLSAVVFGSPSIGFPPLPPRNHARVAREVVHKSNWASIGSISSDPRLKGFPMVTLISIADSAVGSPSTGHIYFMLTDMDFTGKDWNVHNNVTLLLTNDEDLACTRRGLDTMEPTCPRVIIAGNVRKLQPTDKDYDFAKTTFFSRHPAGRNWIHCMYCIFTDIFLQMRQLFTIPQSTISTWRNLIYLQYSLLTGMVDPIK